MADPLARDENRQFDVELDLAHLERRGVPVAHQIADQAGILLHPPGAAAIGDAGRLHDRGVVAHVVDDAGRSRDRAAGTGWNSMASSAGTVGRTVSRSAARASAISAVCSGVKTAWTSSVTIASCQPWLHTPLTESPNGLSLCIHANWPAWTPAAKALPQRLVSFIMPQCKMEPGMQSGGDATQVQSQTLLQPHGTMQGYDPGAFFCEMLRPGASPDPTLTLLMSRLSALPIEILRQRAAEAERDLLERGITFTVYSDATAIDRILPFDLIPRVITPPEWQQIETGVIQRVRALNMFLYDIYHERKILADKIVPAELVLGNSGYCEAMVGFNVPFNTYVHVCGTDIVRDETGTFRVLEDNARTPSGVAYVVENRHMSLRVMSDLMTGLRVRGVDEYGLRLHNAMAEIAPPGVADPQVVVLSPGIFNSAYFEHVFLAREMGVPLVEGRDLTVEGGKVWMRTTAGPGAGAHDLSPDRRRFPRSRRVQSRQHAGRARPDRGVATRRVAIANAVGTGVADDKAIYAYMPRIIKYYLSEEPILPNVDTRICAEADALAYTLDHLAELVVKPVAESGGYGLMIGPHATKAQLAEFRDAAEGRSGELHQPADDETLGVARHCARTGCGRATSICGRSP